MANAFDDVDDAQLEVWAFGREGRVTDRELAESALGELIRRGEERAAAAAAAHRAEQTGAAARAVPASTDHGINDGATTATTADRHARRMRATGRTGLALAALTLLGVSALPVAPGGGGDPLTVFERPATAEDNAWVAQLTRDYVSGVTLGPRSVNLGDGVTAVAFRAAATVDGRSTAYDPYCLWLRDGGSSTAPGSLSGTCTLPERFATEGIAFALRPSSGGQGLDVVAWGPTGGPRLLQNQPVPTIGGIRSVLDWLVFSSVGTTINPLAVVGDRDGLLMGPSVIPLNAEGPAPAVTTWAYLRQGESDDPVLCIVSVVDEPGGGVIGPTQTRSCAPLAAVRRSGISHIVRVEGGDWSVLVGPDGDGRSDRLRLVVD